MAYGRGHVAGRKKERKAEKERERLVAMGQTILARLQSKTPQELLALLRKETPSET